MSCVLKPRAQGFIEGFDSLSRFRLLPIQIRDMLDSGSRQANSRGSFRFDVQHQATLPILDFPWRLSCPRSIQGRRYQSLAILKCLVFLLLAILSIPVLPSRPLVILDIISD